MKEIEKHLLDSGWTVEIEDDLESVVSPVFPLNLQLEFWENELSLNNIYFDESIIVKLNPSIEDIEKFVELLS